MTSMWANIYDTAGDLQGEGPLANVQRLAVTRALDGAGEVSLSALATDRRVQDLIANQRRVVLWTSALANAGPVTLTAGTTGTTYLEIGTDGDSGSAWHGAQMFTATVSGTLSACTVTLGAAVGTPSGTITWEIQAVTTNVPSGSILETGTFTPTPSAVNTIPCANTTVLTAGTAYALVLYPTDEPFVFGNYWKWMREVIAIPGMNMASKTTAAPTWTALTGANLYATFIIARADGPVETPRELGRGIVRKISASEASNGYPLTLSGPDQLDELRNVNCLLGRIFNGDNVDDAVDTLVSLAGWTADTTGVTGTVYARFDGTSVLRALQEIARLKGYHFRLSGDKTITFGALGDDSGLRAIQPGSSVTPELELNNDVLLIDRLTWTHDSEAIANWIVPVSGQMDALLTLAHSTRGGLTSAISYEITEGNDLTQLNGFAGAGGTTTISTGAYGAPIGNSGGLQSRVAQSFQVTAGRLSQITVTFGANSGSPGPLVWYDVQTDDGGVPSGISLLNTTPALAPIVSSTNTITFYYASQVFLEASTTYWLVLYTVDQPLNTYWTWKCDNASVYASGTVATSSDAGETWTARTYDAEMTATTAAYSAFTKLAQPFTSGGESIPCVGLLLGKSGSPLGDLTLEIQGSTGTPPNHRPDGSAVANGTSAVVSSTILAETPGWITFVFANEPALVSGTTYWLVLTTDGVQSNTDYVVWSTHDGPGAPTGKFRTYDGSSWATVGTYGSEGVHDIYERAAHTDPYTLNVAAGAHGRAVHYLSDATSITAYGQIERVFSVKITPASYSETDLATAANALYDAAAAWLARYGTRQTVYRLRVRKAISNLLPGQKLQLVYKGFAYDDAGNLITWLDVDSLFWVTKVTETVDRSGIVTDIEISNLERVHQDVSALIVGTMEQVALGDAMPKSYPYVII